MFLQIARRIGGLLSLLLRPLLADGVLRYSTRDVATLMRPHPALTRKRSTITTVTTTRTTKRSMCPRSSRRRSEARTRRSNPRHITILILVKVLLRLSNDCLLIRRLLRIKQQTRLRIGAKIITHLLHQLIRRVARIAASGVRLRHQHILVRRRHANVTLLGVLLRLNVQRLLL